ncbi:hypothetical protein [Janthinobacterium agaricidamnosum]|uniref:Uncharacterized protein n=1 Tax=Janthinobacterium agaricidamnosum NBRC 102515 = DSM 9628 TaxID=1349767 RepID=W0V352_9BURK|nr:hypothetical protein [Janthinobacterium agaricidamnosum]CDG82301.1 hypothetical protein GJA_1663 [Janthinobacterium agaricidamnosum NBRC 102515 = DSM 9628]
MSAISPYRGAALHAEEHRAPPRPPQHHADPVKPYKPQPPRAPRHDDGAAQREPRQADDKAAQCATVTAWMPDERARREQGGGQDDDKDGQDGKEGGVAPSAGAPPAPDPDLDLCADALLGLGADNGVFELLLPGGRSLNVAVDSNDSRISFLLSTADNGLAKQLREKKMELEGRLQRRMGKKTTVTLL